ncbi:hypothetical protein CF326_g8293 [Tilletia indica]|nr:hypothetical protein CF326_g8293 [Tilletia indica]
MDGSICAACAAYRYARFRSNSRKITSTSAVSARNQDTKRASSEVPPLDVYIAAFKALPSPNHCAAPLQILSSGEIEADISAVTAFVLAGKVPEAKDTEDKNAAFVQIKNTILSAPSFTYTSKTTVGRLQLVKDINRHLKPSVDLRDQIQGTVEGFIQPLHCFDSFSRLQMLSCFENNLKECGIIPIMLILMIETQVLQTVGEEQVIKVSSELERLLIVLTPSQPETLAGCNADRLQQQYDAKRFLDEGFEMSASNVVTALSKSAAQANMEQKLRRQPLWAKPLGLRYKEKQAFALEEKARILERAEQLEFVVDRSVGKPLTDS